MPKNTFDSDALEAVDELAVLRERRAAAVRRWEVSKREVDKHQDDIDVIDAAIDAALNRLPADARAHAAKKSKKPKPWE